MFMFSGLAAVEKRRQQAAQALRLLSAYPSRIPRGKKPFQPLMAKTELSSSCSVTTQVTKVKSLVVPCPGRLGLASVAQGPVYGPRFLPFLWWGSQAPLNSNVRAVV